MVIILLISIVIYIVASVMVYANTYAFEKQQRIKLILFGFIIVLIVTTVIVTISSLGINVENKSHLNTTKITSILLFAPINSVFILPYIGNVFNKYKQKRLTDENVRKRMILLTIFIVIGIILEIGYIKSFEIGLLSNVM